jgi:hypothetical protein
MKERACPHGRAVLRVPGVVASLREPSPGPALVRGMRWWLCIGLAGVLMGLPLASTGADERVGSALSQTLPDSASILSADDAQAVLDQLDGWRQQAADDRSEALQACGSRVFSNRCREAVERGHRELEQRLRAIEGRSRDLLREERNRQQAAARALREREAAERVQAARESEAGARARASEREARLEARERMQPEREREAAERAERSAKRAAQRQAREPREVQDPRPAP